MSVKPVVVRAAAAQCIDDAIDHYVVEGGDALALRFIVALEQAYRHVRRFPATGASRYAGELNIPGLRFWPLKRFPYLLFYIEREAQVDVLLLLHEKRDIPAWLCAVEPDP